MKSKATSFGIAALMVLMAFCCVSVTDEVDADEDDYTTLTGMHFNTGDENKSRLFTVNEGEFYGYKYTITIGVAEIDFNTTTQNYTTLYEKIIQANNAESVSTNNTQIENSIVTITKNTSNEGSYNINITRTIVEAELSYTLGIKIDMKVTVGTVIIDMDSIYLRMTVTTNESGNTNPTLTNMEFEVGKYHEIRVSEIAASSPVLGNINLYHWYAEDLPKGLSMSENGYVSGIAEVAQEINAKVYIFGHEGNGEYTAELPIKVRAATNNPNTFSYTISGGVIDECTNCYDYVAVEGSSLTLTLTSDQPSDFTVESVDGNGNYIPIDEGVNGAYTLTAKGTGCYKVNIVCTNTNDDSQESKFFHIYVIPAFNVVKAQITIASS